MEKNAIKKYAVWARNELIDRVSNRAEKYEVSADADPKAESIKGVMLSETEKKQRAALIAKVKNEGFEQVMEEVAYTWFNRFTALRFMEVNGYIPSHVRVFTDEENNFKPQILAEAIHLDIDGLDMEKVYAYKNANNNDELFKYLIIVQCNALSSNLPGMFQKIADYTELLFPDNLLREGSVIEQMIALIPQDDWKDAVQIIGWLYQYYNTDEFNEIYDGNKSSQNLKKEMVPAATQLFTPDWVVKYMVENSLGRLWVDAFPNQEDCINNWKYYIPAKNGIRNKLNISSPEDIKCIDPCSGSGHILCYMFDLLMQMYENFGFNKRDAVESIVKNNIWGLDIDDRAAQLAYFSVMMKACQYDRRFLQRGIQPNVLVIQESNNVNSSIVDYFVGADKEVDKNIRTILQLLKDAKEYGSIIKIENIDFQLLFKRYEEALTENSLFSGMMEYEILPILKVGIALSQKYDVVCTNPPYLNSSKFNSKLSEYTEKFYEDAKSDLGMVMLDRMLNGFAQVNGYVSAVTTVSWMFIKRFEKFRERIVRTKDFINVVDYGTELFEGKIGHLPIAAWVNQNCYSNSELTAIRLVDFCYSRREEKKTEFYNPENKYSIRQENLTDIPGSPIAYWINDKALEAFEGRKLGDVTEPRMGLTTGKNEKYLRLWFEVNHRDIGFGMSRDIAKQSLLRWFPYDKAGDYRKWFGNRSYIVDWYNDGYEMQTTMHPDGKRIWAHNFNLEYNFREHISWNDVVLKDLSFRFFEDGFLFDSAAATTFVNPEDKYVILAYLNSFMVNELAKLLNPTVHFKLGDYSKLPYSSEWSKEELESLVIENIDLAREDWNHFELSWDFKKHPLIGGTKIEEQYNDFCVICEAAREKMYENENMINKYFSSFYGLKYDEKMLDKESVTYSKADERREVLRLISYAVGCMFGRYSLDADGVICTSEEIDSANYSRFIPDKDNIIPICDDEYFPDDIVHRFVEFLKVVYGNNTLQENLEYVANVLGTKGNSAIEKIRNYFLNDFYTDHCSYYSITGSGKRPIYWLFDSGKKNGFKCLIYMHRYQADTIARIRTDYVHEQQSRYRTEIKDLQQRIQKADKSEGIKLTKQLSVIKDKEDELHSYEEKIHHLADQMISIDLDDGVKVNYEKFKDVLAKIK